MILKGYATSFLVSKNPCGNLSVYLTDDGSISLHSSLFHEGFHSSSGALSEAQDKFLQSSQLDRFTKNTCVRLLDVCVGMGYNSACIIENLINNSIYFQWWGLEIDRRPLKIGLKNLNYQLRWSEEVKQILTSIHTDGYWKNENSQGNILWGDARKKITLIPNEITFDLILLDAFSPSKCPMLWTEEFLSKLARKLAPGGRLITYSSAAAIRSSLRRAGLELASQIPSRNEKRKWSNGTIGVLEKNGLCHNNKEVNLRPLTPREEEHLLTKAAVPYRDPSGHSNKETILERREKEQKISKMEITSQWKRRWEKTDKSSN